MKTFRDSLTSPKFWDKLNDAPDEEVTAPARITDVQMVVLSATDIKKMSVCPVQTTTLYEKSLPRAYGINDIRMGTVDRNLRCGTCLNGMLACNGHTAHIDLPMSVYHISYISDLVKIFRCICLRCLCLIAKPTDPTFQRIQEKFKDLPKQRFSAICNYLKNKKLCANCKFLVPKYSQQAFVIKREWSAQMKKQFVPESEQKKEKYRKKSDPVPYVPNGEKYQQPFTPSLAKSILEIIDDDVFRDLGLSPELTHPKNFIIDTLLVPPPIIRPSIMFSESSRTRGQDDLTHKLQEILKASQKMEKSLEDEDDVSSNFELLQMLVATYMNNESAGAKMPTKKRSGFPEKCVVKRLKGKKGRFRGNLMGKRVDFSARTVIGPDTYMDVGELGIPERAALKLTYPEVVTAFNIELLRKRVRKGHGVLQGAKSIVKSNGQRISLEMCKKSSVIRLQLGWTVERYMQNGDYVLFNRQPSLRKKSIMAHKVRIMPGRTFRLNLSCTGPYNGDFDGDEMNVHVLQNVQAVTEAKLLMSVESQLLNAQNNKPCMGIVQDALLGSFLLSKKDEFLTEAEFMQLVMHVHYPKSKKIPQPAILRPERLYTGKQALSLVLPQISITKKKDRGEEAVIIRDGELLQGRLCKQTLGASSGGIVHVTCKYLSNAVAMNFMSDCQRLVNTWLESQGFSIGLSDCMTTKETEAKVHLAVEACVQHVKKVAKLGKELKLPFNCRESDASQILSKMLNVTGGIVQDKMEQDNALSAMISSGSKGNPINISQISGCVGQQSIEGHRVFDDMNPEERTLACFEPRSDDPESRGFVRSSYVRGLNPEELFFHTMGGREGIVDTSVKCVTWDTEIVITFGGSTFCTPIGQWVDKLMASNKSSVEVFPRQMNLELLHIENAMIPTMTADGVVTWGHMTAVSRHDPSQNLYHIITLSGREVTVVKSKSLIVWDPEHRRFLPMSSENLQIGDYLPSSALYPDPPHLLASLNTRDVLSPSRIIHGADFLLVAEMVPKTRNSEMGWWEKHNHRTFTLPYTNIEEFKCAIRSQFTLSLIKKDCVYPRHDAGEQALIPSELKLDRDLGVLFGLFLAEDLDASKFKDHVRITSDEPVIVRFVKTLFNRWHIRHETDTVKLNSERFSTTIRGFSVVLVELLIVMMGAQSVDRRIPEICYSASRGFLLGILDGYICGNGHVSENGIITSSVSKSLTQGISWIYTRLGVFGQMRTRKETHGLLNMYDIDVQSHWLWGLAQNLTLLHPEKQQVLCSTRPRTASVDLSQHHDVVLDKVISIEITPSSVGQKVYDVSVPSTGHFITRNGLGQKNTADTGYLQRRIIKALENISVEYDGSIRDSYGNIIELWYGDDNCDAAYLEKVNMFFLNFTTEKFVDEFGPYNTELVVMIAAVHQCLRCKISLLSPQLDTLCHIPVNVALLLKQPRSKSSGDRVKPEKVTREVHKLVDRFKDQDGVQTLYMRATFLYHLRSRHIVDQLQLSDADFDRVLMLIEQQYNMAIVNPGEMVGVLAGQSVGEPCTQLTLNSLDYEERIIVRDTSTGVISTPKIGSFIDELFASNTDSRKLQYYEKNGTEYLDTQHLNLEVPDISEAGSLQYNKLEGVTRHPPPSDAMLIRITTQTGRSLVATPSKSFLLRKDNLVTGVKGSDLKVGDAVPLVMQFPEPIARLEKLEMSTWFAESQSMNGSDLHSTQDCPTRTGFIHDDNLNFNTFHKSSHSTTATSKHVFHSLSHLHLDGSFGLLVGTFMTKGRVIGSSEQLCISDCNAQCCKRIADWCDKYEISYNIKLHESTSRDIHIHSVPLCKFLQASCGNHSCPAHVPDFAYGANKNFLRGLIDGYISIDGFVSKKRIAALSVSKHLLDGIALILSMFGVGTQLHKPSKKST